MIKIDINNKRFWLKLGLTVLEVCKYAGITIPRFCYHESLSVAGNCRMCLVEINGSPKPVASCAMPAVTNMKVFVDTPLVKKARENILEFLLLNHPLDCPICDQGGECDLQDQTKLFGNDVSRFFFNRRGVEDKFCGPIIKTIMTRCIHCTRCVRYGSEIAGIDFFGTLNRGSNTEISNYIQRFYNSEVSGNVVDLCPVGALTSKPYVFRSRPWELRSVETIDLTDSLGVDTYVNFKESEVFRVIPKYSNDLKMSFISDKSRFIYESLKLNRITEVYTNETKLGFVRSSWQSALLGLNVNSTPLTFVINEGMSYESLSLLKSLSFRSKSAIKVLSCSRNNHSIQNIYFNGFLNTVSDLVTNSSSSQVCFLFSTNIKIESALINIKLRLKSTNENLSVTNIGVNRPLNYPVLTYNFGEIPTLKIFSGKSAFLSKMLLTLRPLIIFGENFFEGLARQNVIQFIKSLNSGAIILNVTSNNSSENFRLLNIKSICSKFLRNTKNIATINLPDRNLIHKIFYKYNFNKIISFNTHGTELIRKSNFIFPISVSGFEDGGIFFNLEQKPKRAHNILLNCVNSRPFHEIVLCFYSMNSDFYKTFTTFIHESLRESISLAVSRGSSNMLTRVFKFSPVLEIGYKSLGHSNIEDFYLTSLHSKNSPTLLLCSKESFKFQQNFLH